MIRRISIPKERIPVLIGTRGKTKREIEYITTAKIAVGEEIVIDGDAPSCITAENIIIAIGRGFAPDKALLLVNEEYSIIILELPHNYRALKRISSRLIGTNGKARRNLEQMTKCLVSVYGKTVGIIGHFDDISTAKIAIERLISGASHKTVWEFIRNRHENRNKHERKQSKCESE